jgi:hypothetical protein
MTITDRQQTLFLAEDWTKLYQSFRSAQFDSYDFDTVRRAMIDYLQLYYPEDFNDFIESSEYVALIDLIAYVTQSISYRLDLNARENFLDTAQRRDSILRLARFLNYKPKRNQAVQGLVKITNISTSESVIDSLGNDLANTIINWNDPANPDYLEQFTAIFNASIQSPQKVGKPIGSKILNNIKTDLYRFNIPANLIPITRFSQTIEGQRLNFEVVSADITDKDYIYESSPNLGNYGFLYRNDGRGNGSSNTGYFMYWKQGALGNFDLNFPVSVPNDFQTINVTNINETDVWLFELDQSGNLSDEWLKLEATAGTNVIYNSLSKDIRKIFAINSLDADQIQIEFADGVFADMPKGNFRLFYRQSDGVTTAINNANFPDVIVNIPYIDVRSRAQTLTLTLTLTNSYDNGSQTEDQIDIQTKAPLNFYSQNRMVTGEDYTVFPLTINQNIVKVKAINRTSSGISKFLDIIDPTQKYSSTTTFASDGFMYREDFTRITNFTFNSENDIRYNLFQNVENVMGSVGLRNFYLKNYNPIDIDTLNVTWETSTETNTGVTGYFLNSIGSPQVIGSFTSNNLKYIEPDCFLKFESRPTDSSYQTSVGNGTNKVFSLSIGTSLSNNAQILVNDVEQVFGVDYYTNSNRNAVNFITAPAALAEIKILPQKLYFVSNGTIVASDIVQEGYTDVKWSSVATIVGDGTNNGVGNLLNGLGPVELNQYMPTTAKLTSLYPKLVTTINENLLSQMITLIQNYRNFGLRYDYNSRQWNIITDADLNETGNFSLTNSGDTSGNGSDSSWIIKLTNDGIRYTVTSRELNYVFGSALEHRFYFESSDKIYDYKSGSVVKDNVYVNRTNLRPEGSEALTEGYYYLIYDNIKDIDGFVLNDRILINFYDYDDNSIPDHPDSFNLIVSGNTSYIFFEKYIDAGNFPRYQWISKNNFVLVADHYTIDIIDYLEGQLFYEYTTNSFYQLTNEELVLLDSSLYQAKYGRDNLNFEHTHFALNNRRIDPSVSNIIELYILTQNYDTNFRAWLSNGQIGSMPVPPTSDDLNIAYSSLYNYKSISDEIIFKPVKYRTLFGITADIKYQATFKVIKNASSVVGDNEVKTRLIQYVNDYFSLGNFDFGDTFYFTELVAHLHKNMAGIANSIVIVPNDATLAFGSLFEIKSQSDELFISTATVSNVDIIQGISTETIRASGGVN